MSDVVIGQGSTTLDYLRIRHEWLGQLIDQGIAERDALKARVAELEAALQKAYEVASGGNGKSSPMIGYWGRLLAKSS